MIEQYTIKMIHYKSVISTKRKRLPFSAENPKWRL